MQPSEFWELSLTEFWWEFDSHVAKSEAMKTPAEGPGPGHFSRAEWQAARKLHKEKMNG